MITIRQGLKNVKQMVPAVRTMSSQGNLTNISVDNEGIAILTLQRPPVNSLNLELLQDINKSLDEIAKNKCKGMILTSASPTVFSAGLDIMEMYKPDLKRVDLFWTTLQDVWLKLYECAPISAAAINGHAPAGGCLLAMSCEYRAMVSGKFTIGLNETALGIVAPIWFMNTLKNVVPSRQAEVALTLGRMFTVDEAFKNGCIDEIATDKQDAIDKCKAFIKQYDKIPPLARVITKRKFRSSVTQWLKENREADKKEFVDNVVNPKVQQSLEMYIQALKNKSK